MKEKNRLKWLDIAKGIAIILMVAGHTTIPQYFSDFIWAFHMPLFFIASGFATNWSKWNSMPIEEFLLRKVKNLLVPFFSYSLIVLTIAIPQGFITLQDFLCNGWRGFALWFIPVLFIGLFIVRLIMSINILLRIVFAIFFAVLGSVLCYYDVFLPWKISSVPYAVFLILLGSYSKKLESLIEKPRLIVFISGFVITVLVSHYCRLDMAWNHINPLVVTTIGAISGTLMVFTISSYIACYCKPVARVLELVGKETYIVLALSQIIIMTMITYTRWNSFVRYMLLVVFLVMIVYIKNYVNKLAKTKIL